MLLRDLVEASADLTATRSRKLKTDIVANVLRRATADEVGAVTAYLSGLLPQRRVGVSWRRLAVLPEPAEKSTLTVSEVDHWLERLSQVSGQGSASVRAVLVQDLFASATAAEQQYLRALVTGDVRQGALDGIMLQAITQAAEVPEAAVRRAVMLAGHAAPVAAAALTGGMPALAAVGLEVGRPIRPMLAASAPDVGAAIAQLSTGGGELAVDVKLDGIRIQAHKRGSQVRLFTRTLEEVTDRLPEVTEMVCRLPAEMLVLDGEVVALEESGRPRPFQETAARTSSRRSPDQLRSAVPVSPYFFDVLHVDGRDLLDEPASVRSAELSRLVPGRWVASRLVTRDTNAAQMFFVEQVARGQEGVVVKSLTAPYAAGRRGAGWVKVKPRHTLDLVVLAVEWGSGRRKGLLSNIHLGARDPETEGFVMLGKTFKGMTDQMLAWQTERFLALEQSHTDWAVTVRPEQVVEVAFDGIQRSPRYPGGVALRFARVLRYRDDKTAEEADTIDVVRALGDAAIS